MKSIIKNDLLASICIGVSYILLWMVAEVFAVNFNWKNFVSATTYIIWANLYVLFINLFITHVLQPFNGNKNRKTLHLLLSIAIVLLLLSYGFFYWSKLGSLWLTTFRGIENEKINAGFLFRSILYQLIGMLYFSFIKLIIRNVKLKHRNQQLEIEKKKTELDYLKSQTNPHFLFNTLNNIYALARMKSNLTEESILKLSDILRYMLYGSDNAYVPIQQEIKIIEEYIALEKLRYDNSLQIRINTIIQDPETKIPPLLLIPLVENAFKHGVSETIYAPFINITIQVSNNLLNCIITNSIDRENTTTALSENIGLKNLKRQLELLFANYSLDIDKKHDSFNVYLKIDLNSYAKN